MQEILAMKSRLEEIEKEAAALREMREAQEREAKAIAAVAAQGSPTAMETDEDSHAVDERSVYVGNVGCLSVYTWIVLTILHLFLLFCRLIIVLHRRKFRLISKRVGQ